MLAIAISIGLLSLQTLSEPSTIKGRVQKNPKDNRGYVEGISVLAKVEGKIVSRTNTDSEGNFLLTFAESTSKAIDLFGVGIGMDTLLLFSGANGQVNVNNLRLYLPALVKKNVVGRAYCPKCRRTDKVYKIRHSLSPVYVRKISSKGDTTYLPIYKGYYQEDDMDMVATYYCDRDKAKF